MPKKPSTSQFYQVQPWIPTPVKPIKYDVVSGPKPMKTTPAYPGSLFPKMGLNLGQK